MKAITIGLFLSIFTITTFSQCSLNIDYKLDGFVLDLQCVDQFDVPMISLEIVNIDGGSGTYAIEALGSGKLSNTLATTGNGFIYNFSEEDQSFGNLGFTISDGANEVCQLDQTLIIQISSIPFYCFESNCEKNIEVEFETGTYQDIFNCNEDEMSISVKNIFGGDSIYTISTLGLGTINYVDISNSLEFTYTINQQDIDSKTSEVGFLIEDSGNCKTRFDLSGKLAFTNIDNICNPVSINENSWKEEITVFPTLVKSNFNVKVNTNLTINKIKIIDLQGKVVSQISDFITTNFDISNLQTGIYTVQINTNKGLLFKKIIKQ